MARSSGEPASAQAANGAVSGREEPRPKVSVLLQTYNHERFIGRAIESVVRQDTPFPIEVIVSDDYSNDGTRAHISTSAQTHPQLIKPLFPDHHLGMNPLFRRALDTARGEYLALLDGDDYWTSVEKLRKQVALLDSEPELTGCFHDALVVSEEGARPTRRYIPEPKKKERFELDDLLPLCYPPTLSVVLRRDVLEHVPDWVFDFAWTDWLIWIFATRQGPFAYIDEVMGVYRVHEGGYFSSQDRSTQLEEDLRVYRRLRDELPAHGDLIERCMTQRACELAVEECGLPYDSPLLVVGDFHDLPLLFNGRTTRCLEASGDGSATDQGGIGSAVAQLERLCRAVAPPTMPFWPSRTAPRESGGRSCYVVVAKGSRTSSEQHCDLAARLERQGATLWDNDQCAIYELSDVVEAERPGGEFQDPAHPPLAKVVDVSRADPPDERIRGRIERPSVGSVVHPSAVRVVGWAVGHEGPVAGIELVSDGNVIWRTAVGVERPDLAKEFATYSWAGKAGFAGDADLFDAIAPNGRSELKVNAVLPNGGRIGTIKLRHPRY
jgi:glycosyltransferase involved in cell wall biosynthesis